MARSYIARSALTSFILDVSRTWDARLTALTIDFADATWTGCNWRVASIEPGGAKPSDAHAIVAHVVRGNSGWIMVEDGSDLDGQDVPDAR